MKRNTSALPRVELLALPLTAMLLACSGAKDAVELPPQSMNDAAPYPSAQAPPPPSEGEGIADWPEPGAEVAEAPFAAAAAEPEPEPVAEASKPRDPTLVVIGEAEDEDEEGANPLLRASLAERRRRQTAPAAVAVITDKNLKEFAEGGKVTFVKGAPTPLASEAVVPGAGRRDEELYWRTRVRGLRAEWRHNFDLIEELEAQAADLRRRFYAEDDPYVRDRRIKPEWDRTLDRLEEARRATDRAQEELDVALEEGRRAGALPGWLRDGSELEPTPRVEEEMPEYDPEEPTVVDP